MLEKSIHYLVYSLLPFESGSRAGDILAFFLYDSIKILALLFFMIAFIGFFRSYISQAKIKAWIEKQPKFVGHLTAAMFGALTPFCSCSSIPIFLGFLEAGIPLGIAMSFIITSPMLNEYLFALMLGYFGWKIAVVYAISGVLIGVFASQLAGETWDAVLQEEQADGQ